VEKRSEKYKNRKKKRTFFEKPRNNRAEIESALSSYSSGGVGEPSVLITTAAGHGV